VINFYYNQVHSFIISSFCFSSRLPDDVEKELIACKSYMLSVEQHAGSFECVGRSYSEKKSKHDIQIREVEKYKNALKVCESL
jgi:hypothetical protein